MCVCQFRGGVVVVVEIRGGGGGGCRRRSVGWLWESGLVAVGGGAAGERGRAATSETYHVEVAVRPLRGQVRLDPEVEELERGHPETGVHHAVVARLRSHDHSARPLQPLASSST